MTTSANTTLVRAPQTASDAPDAIQASPIFPQMSAALKLFSQAMYAEKAGRRATKTAFGISDVERRAAILWDKAEAAFDTAALVQTSSQTEANLATLCAQIAIYLDDAGNARGINPRKIRLLVRFTAQNAEAQAMTKATQGLLATYAGLLSKYEMQPSLLAA
jgi:hypothetical protein